MIFTHHSVYL